MQVSVKKRCGIYVKGCRLRIGVAIQEFVRLARDRGPDRALKDLSLNADAMLPPSQART